jgi:hypothetical protein
MALYRTAFGFVLQREDRRSEAKGKEVNTKDRKHGQTSGGEASGLHFGW